MDTKKELKEAYKRRKVIAGVYQIRNKANNKIYVGSSNDLTAIWNRNQFQLNGGLHLNAALQKEWKEYGGDSFVYEILAELKESGDEPRDYKKEAEELELLYIEELQPFGDKGYNEK
jgi:group I intron endonuclease